MTPRSPLTTTATPSSPPDDSDAGAAFGSIPRRRPGRGDGGETRPFRRRLARRVRVAPSSPRRGSAPAVVTEDLGDLRLGAGGVAGGTTELSALTSSLTSRGVLLERIRRGASTAVSAAAASERRSAAAGRRSASAGLIVPRAQQSPHALHSERTPLGPRRMTAWRGWCTRSLSTRDRPS